MIRNLTKGAFGPSGMCAVLRANQFSGASTVSAVGGRFLADYDLLTTNDPIGRLLLKQTAVAQHENHGDGSLATAFIACSLIERTMERGPLSPATRALTVATFQRCLEWCAEHLRLHSPVAPSLGMPLRVSHLPSMLALLRSVLSPKILAAPDADAVDIIAVQLLQAFILVCPKAERAQVNSSLFADFTSGIRIHKVVGGPHELSRCVEGIIIDTPVPVGPSDEQQLEYTPGGRVLVFIAALDVKLVDERSVGVVKFEENARRWVPRAEQERRLASTLVGACQQLQIKVVICQRVINRHLQEQLVKAGIVPLERVSVRHIDAVVRLTGARPLGPWYQEPESDPAGERVGCDDSARSCLGEWPKSYGICGAINPVHLGGQRFTLIRPPSPETLARSCVLAEKKMAHEDASRSFATLILCAPTEPEIRELDAVVRGAMACKRKASARQNKKVPYERVLASAFHKPEVVAGGGCTETLLAGCVRARARAVAETEANDDKRSTSAQHKYYSHLDANHLTRGEAAMDWKAVEIFASSLEELASAIAPPDIRTELFTSEYIAHANACMLLGGPGAGFTTPKEKAFLSGQFQFLGWEMGAGRIVSVASGDVVGGSCTLSGARILDFLPAKLETLRKAVETACVALRVESTAPGSI